MLRVVGPNEATVADPVATACATTVAYFDVHACAPRLSEVHRFLVGERASRSEVEEALGRLEGERVVERSGDFWSLFGKRHLVPRRIRFLEHSRRLWPEARAIARFIERSGLATSGMVTGSLAADNADEHADIDFLFTYPAERTWTSFAAVRILGKIPSIGLDRCCPNYALPEDRLEVRPNNLFTAWELAKAVPMFGFDVYDRLMAANAWARRFLPNAFPRAPSVPEPRTDPRWAKALTSTKFFRAIEDAEKQRKFGREKLHVGVDMRSREREGRADRHSPVRSSFVLSELRYRIEQLGLSGNPIFPDLHAETAKLNGELVEWAGTRLET